MTPHKGFLLFLVVYFFGVSALILRVPQFIPFLHRILRRGELSDRHIKRAKRAAYLGIVFGCLALWKLFSSGK
jgi:hypothetical protein